MSTVKNADCIVALNEGKVAEVGTHNELLHRKGIYFQLVMAQENAEMDANDLTYKGLFLSKTENGKTVYFYYNSML